ncbi:MAG TPA: S8 family serine peptidase, partial [Thermoanaerobaculia bacterium]|nr:S8 family serine peptidase [Thermoanaerobaculia bacterium]
MIHRLFGRFDARRRLVPVLFLLFAGIPSGPAFAQAQGGPNGISESAARQIQALLDEKESRTPAQKKIDSILLQAFRERHGGTLAAGVTTLERADVGADADGNVVVDLGFFQMNPGVLNTLRGLGAEILNSSETYKTARIRVSLDRLETIAGLPAVRVIHSKDELDLSRSPAAEAAAVQASESDERPSLEARKQHVRQVLRRVLPLVGSKQSEGDKTHLADTARSTYGYDGSGIRIGVISDSVDGLAASQASLNLGAVTVLAGQSGVPGTGEGTAMLDIVHDIAPGAQLFFSTANPTQAQFAANITALAGPPNNCNVIVDDVSYFAEPVFEDGPIAQAVQTFTDAGGLYFASAGNSGNVTSGTAGVWEGDFVDGGASAAPLPLTGNVHQFQAMPAQNYTVVNTASTRPLYLFWSDKFAASGNDYDLFVLNSAGSAVTASSTTTQSGSQDPLESVNAPAAASRIVVLKKTGAAVRYLHVQSNRGVLSIATNGQTARHSAAAGAFSVAATPAVAPGPYPGPFTAANTIETFSSDGPRRMFYDIAGNPVNCCTAVTGGVTRQKPNITAADGVTTSVAGFAPFYGTSAAAPHAAAIAGLIRSAGRTAAQTRTDMTGTAIDIMTAGVDVNSGNGIVMAKAAFDSFAPAAVANVFVASESFTDGASCGNANGAVEPGEDGLLSLTLTNGGAVSSMVSASLSLTTPIAGVTVVDGASRNFGMLNAGASGNNSGSPFRFHLDPSVACGQQIDFNLTVTYTSGAAGISPATQQISVKTGSLPVTIATTLDTTAPPSTPPYTAITGNTTLGRLNRLGNPSSCAVSKACQGVTGTGTRRFDAYTFTNTSASSICVDISLVNTCTGATNAMFVSAYTPTFDPANLCTNFLGDAASSQIAG